MDLRMNIATNSLDGGRGFEHLAAIQRRATADSGKRPHDHCRPETGGQAT